MKSLIALKSLIEEGEKAIVFEKTSNIGGIWNYNSNNGCYYTLVTNTSRNMTMYSDFPHKDDNKNELENYQRHYEFMEYLNDFSSTFQLHNFIKLNSTVTSIEYNSSSTHWTLEVHFSSL